MIVAPIEPVVLQRVNLLQALALRGSRDCTALKVPLAGCRSVEQRPCLVRRARSASRSARSARHRSLCLGYSSCCGVTFRLALQKELRFLAINPADENAK